MKKLYVLIFAITIILMTASVQDLFAQRVVKNYNQSIGVNPIGLAFGFFNAKYEQQVSADNSFTVDALYWGFAGWSAFGVGGSYRWYLLQENDKALRGFSFGPAVSIGFWSFENATWGGGTSLGIGGEAAYKWVFEGGFVVEPYVSITFNALDLDGLSYRPFGMGVVLGYAW
ncbi:MAG: hypothetical protein M9949_13895 [Candidatus Kapabacteria bacterium]|nr:hypothetical protein [Candidatus Kapabacteria bacterium]